MIRNDTPKLLNRLQKHVPFGIEARQPRPTKAQLGPFWAPGIGVEPQKLAPQFGHIRLDFKRLLKFSDGLWGFAQAFIDDAQTHMGRDIFGVGSNHALKEFLGCLKLAQRNMRFAQNEMCFQIVGERA